jgi:cell division septal protein FtsQ
LLLIVGALVYVHLDARWFVYRDTVQLNGLTYLNADDLYAASGIDSWHSLWLRPQSIRARLLQQPFVQEANVAIHWPNRVTIEITEQLPVALWLTKAETLWLMPGGEALAVADNRFSALPSIIDPGREAQDVRVADRPAIDPAVLAGALALRAKLPAITELRYNRDYGLNFHLPGAAAWVYWGDGENLSDKFAYLEAIQQLIDTGKAQPQIIDVRFARPYFR